MSVPAVDPTLPLESLRIGPIPGVACLPADHSRRLTPAGDRRPDHIEAGERLAVGTAQ